MKKCTRCGNCCRSAPCLFSITYLGSNGTCEALVFEADKRGNMFYACGLMKHPARYIWFGANVKIKSKLFADVVKKTLGVGLGCCITPVSKYTDKSVRNLLKNI